MQPADFVRVAADRDRLAVLGRLAVAPARAAELAGALGITERDVLRRLARLGSAGLVREEAGVFRLDDDVLRSLASAAAVETGAPRAAHPSVLAGLDAAEAELAQRYFRGSQLVEIPAAPGRRDAVLRILDMPVRRKVSKSSRPPSTGNTQASSSSKSGAISLITQGCDW